jgi:hypothetical protein
VLIHVYIYICISVYCLYIVYNYLGMTPSGTTVVLLLLYIYIFYLPCISLFYSFVCSSHLCILSYMHVPYGAFFIIKEFEFENLSNKRKVVRRSLQNFPIHVIRNKGNNKITELRTI